MGDVIFLKGEEIFPREDATSNPVMGAIKAVVREDSADLVHNTEMAATRAVSTEILETGIITLRDQAADLDPAADRRVADSEDPDLHRAGSKEIIVKDRLSTRNCL
jgi:hypothetical protein